MLDDGHYATTYGTLFGTGHVRLRLEGDRVTGTTDRGIPVEGTIQIDVVRKLLQFHMAAHLPAFFTGVTGIATAATGRTVRFKGEASPTREGARFSIDFAGRALDVHARYAGPLETAR
jgi:hypothetical protein